MEMLFDKKLRLGTLWMHLWEWGCSNWTHYWNFTCRQPWGSTLHLPKKDGFLRHGENGATPLPKEEKRSVYELTPDELVAYFDVLTVEAANDDSLIAKIDAANIYIKKLLEGNKNLQWLTEPYVILGRDLE